MRIFGMAWGSVNARVVAGKQSLDGEDEQDRARKINRRRDAEQAFDAEAALPQAAAEQREAGQAGGEKIEHAHGRSARIGRHHFKGRGKNVADPKAAKESKARGGEAGRLERVAVTE